MANEIYSLVFRQYWYRRFYIRSATLKWFSLMCFPSFMVCTLYVCYACVSGRYMCVCVMCAPIHVEARGRHQVSCSIALCLIPFRPSLSLNLELGWWPASPSIPVPAPLQRWDYRHTWPCLTFLWVLGIWTLFLCLHSKCSHLLSHLPALDGIFYGHW